MAFDVFYYHEQTKHHLHKMARSLGYLDWSMQPEPFRRYDGTTIVPLPLNTELPAVRYDALFASGPSETQPLTTTTLSDFLRYSLGISAWKQQEDSRWALRVNPSSGNLHPTEAYLALGPVPGLSDSPGVFHYAPEDHELERRVVLPDTVWESLLPDGISGSFLVGLSSIPWRESWKYGERAFRYCQHDMGHAMAAMRLAAVLLGWKMRLLTDWPDAGVGTIFGLDRKEGFIEGEREIPEIIAQVYPAMQSPAMPAEPKPELIQVISDAEWQGRANRLSTDHISWDIINRVIDVSARTRVVCESGPDMLYQELKGWPTIDRATLDARRIILQRRSAVSMDNRSTMPLDDFIRLMIRVLPAKSAPWDLADCEAFIHLAIFVHRVDDLQPGLYMLVRNRKHLKSLRSATGDQFLWRQPEHMPENLPLYALELGDYADLAAGLSCRQDIAGDGFFSLGMLAKFEKPITAFGQWYYRNLFWEAGIIGQVLYLEAEAAGFRGTGLGCYFDDPVHQVLGIRDRSFQSLYHFTVGKPVEDSRIVTLPAYAAELKGDKKPAS